MKQFFANTDRKPSNILVSVSTPRPTKIHIRAIDPYKKGALYLDRWNTVEGTEDFEIRLPQSPKKLLVKVWTEKGEPFEVTNLQRVDLEQYKPCLIGKETESFLEFAKQFSEDAGILAAGRYQSDDKMYTIDYLPVIKHEGKTLSTPARISNSTGRMEISQAKYSKMSIPMRMAILCHEFSHYYMNEIQKDEIEADLNALTLYLSLGYPIIEAHKAFLETFHNTPTETNKERYAYLKTFIDNFDDLKHRICNVS